MFRWSQIHCRVCFRPRYILWAGIQQILGKYPTTLIKCLQSYTGVVHDSGGLIFRHGGFLCVKPPHLSKHISLQNQQELFVHV